jgi:hypothetical protein
MIFTPFDNLINFRDTLQAAAYKYGTKFLKHIFCLQFFLINFISHLFNLTISIPILRICFSPAPSIRPKKAFPAHTHRRYLFSPQAAALFTILVRIHSKQQVQISHPTKGEPKRAKQTRRVVRVCAGRD